MSCEKCQKEQEMLQEIILKHKDTPGALIPILHEAQNIYGYLPPEVLHEIAKGLTDCFAETGRGLGLAYNRKGFYFRIDHILCSDHFTPYNCQVDDKIDASDHYPILCWLKLVHKP